MSYIGSRPVDAIGVKSGATNPVSGSTGELFFNTVSSALLVWNGTAWVEVSGASVVPTGGSLPGSGTEGQLFYLTTEDRVHVYTGSDWIPLNGTLYGSTPPVSGTAGDLFFDTDTQSLYVWNGTSWDIVGGASNVNAGSVTPGAGANVGELFYNTVSESLLLWDGSAWQTISTVTASLVPTGSSLPGSATNGEVFYNTTNHKFYVYSDGAWLSLMPGELRVGSSNPGSGTTGQLFYNSTDGNVYAWDGAAWILVGGTDSKFVVVGSGLPGSGDPGDLFFNTADSSLYVHDGTSWVSVMGGGGGSGVQTGSSLPGSGTDGDLFYNTTNYILYVRSNGAWIALNSDATAGSGTSFPGSPITGQLFFNTTDGVLYVWNGSAWVPLNSLIGSVPVETSDGISATPTGSLASIFTAPGTSGRRYILSSLQATNISGIDDETITADIYFDSISLGAAVANNIPLPAGSSVELLKAPKILQPSDIVRCQASNSGAVSVSATYTTSTDTKLFGTGADLTSTNATSVYTASAKSRIDSILITNDSSSDATVTVSWTNSSNAVQAYFAFEMIVPQNSTIELIEKPKIIASGHKIRAQAGDANTIEVIVCGRTV